MIAEKVDRYGNYQPTQRRGQFYQSSQQQTSIGRRPRFGESSSSLSRINELSGLLAALRQIESVSTTSRHGRPYSTRTLEDAFRGALSMLSDRDLSDLFSRALSDSNLDSGEEDDNQEEVSHENCNSILGQQDDTSKRPSHNFKIIPSLIDMVNDQQISKSSQIDVSQSRALDRRQSMLDSLIKEFLKQHDQEPTADSNN